jgi:Zn-dependent protease with chaperone function
MGLGLALGDVSAIVSTGSALLTGLSYRRSHEREADCYAIDLMRHAALPTAPMGALLLAIAHEEETEAQKPGAPAPEADQGKARSDTEAHPVWSLLSSHPDTVERASALQRGQAPHCPQMH